MPRSLSNLSNDRRSSAEPDLVKDVPENAVGSPETPTGGLLTEQDAKKNQEENKFIMPCERYYRLPFSSVFVL